MNTTKKHIRNYSRTLAAINRSEREEIRKNRERLTVSCCRQDEGAQIDDDGEVYRFRTDEEIERDEKAIIKSHAALRRELDKADGAEAFVFAQFDVSWYKSRTWGFCPRCEAAFRFSRGSGSASGCGYDKESAAINDAIDDGAASSFLRLLIENQTKIKNEGVYPFGVWRGLPRFHFNGCGVCCLRSLAMLLGFKWEERHGKSFDFYEMSKKGGRA